MTQSVEKNAHYQHLKSFVIDTTGMVFYADMDEELARIIGKRMDATGAEPYTLAIVLDNDFGGQLAGWTVEIIGSGINKKFLAHAQRGQFHGSLADDGWLVAGHSEPDMKLFRAFRSVNAPGAVLYQKSDFAGETDSPAEPPPQHAPLAVPPADATQP